jgi:hypothetical protein
MIFGTLLLSKLLTNTKLTGTLLVAGGVLVAILGTAASFLFWKNGDLHNKLGEQKADYEGRIANLKVDLDRMRIAVDAQNSMIRIFEAEGAQKQKQVDAATQQAAQLRKQTNEQIKKYREMEIRNLTCEQAIDLLYTSVPELTWVSPRGEKNDK